MRAGRILWVTYEPPDRSGGGGAIRQSYLLEAIGRAFPTDVLVAGRLDDEVVRKSVASVHEVAVRQRRGVPGRLLGRLVLLARVGLWPGPMETWFSRPARRALARHLRPDAANADLVLIEHEALAPLAGSIERAHAVLGFQHVLSVMAAQEGAKAESRRWRWIWRLQARKAQRLEARALHDFSAVTVCSDDDADALRKLGPWCDVTVVPNGANFQQFSVTSIPADARLLLPGTLCYPPNVDGLRWFVDSVFPLVRRRVPEAALDVVGRMPLPEVHRLVDRPGVHLSANVASMIPYFERARVVVVPVRVGTGTRLKALEGLAAARPVVGTTVGLGGLGLVDGVTARIADDAGAMADAIVELLHDDRLAAELASAGRRFAEAHYGWDAIGAQFVAWLAERLAASRPHPEAVDR